MLFPGRDTACLSLAFHARGAWSNRNAVKAALEAGNDTCAKCQTRIPGWMEIHHLNLCHSDWRQENLVPICHFCHLAEHPAQPGFARNDHPLRIIWWPELTQQAIMACAWSLAWMRGYSLQAEESVAGRINRYLQELTAELARRQKAAGSPHPADFLAAAARPPPPAWSSLRFFPAEVLEAGSGSLPMRGPQLRRWLPTGMDDVSLSQVFDGKAPADHLKSLRSAGRRLATEARTA